MTAKLADFLTAGNRFPRPLVRIAYAPEVACYGNLPTMAETLGIQTARRLKAIREELGMDQPAMAEWLGVGRTRYIGWERAANLPNEHYMVILCDRTGLTMDYIYRGRMDGVPLALAIRITAREDGQDPDAPGFEPKVPQMAQRAKAKA